MKRIHRMRGRTTLGLQFVLLLALAAFIPAATAQQGLEGLQLLAQYQSQAKVYVVGDVQKVLAGTVTYGNLMDLDPGNILFSLGAGSFDDEKGIKEMLALNGTVYLKGLNPENNYAIERSKAVLRSPFTFGMKKRTLPNKILYFEPSAPTTLEDLYAHLMGGYERTFGIFGVALFDEIKTTALKAPPIYNEPISTPATQAKYFHPVGSFKDRVGVFFGVAVDPRKEVPGGKYDTSFEGRMFYISFADKATLKLQSHSHVLFPKGDVDIPRLRDSEAAIKWASALEMEDIHHLLTSSKVKRALLLVYDVQGYTPYAGETAVIPGAAELAGAAAR
jgi:hypothetical protein